MRTLICGGRNFRDFDFLAYSLHSLDPKPSLIITGSQRSITSKLGIFFGADHKIGNPNASWHSPERKNMIAVARAAGIEPVFFGW